MSKFELEKKWQQLILEYSDCWVQVSLRGDNQLAIKCDFMTDCILHTFFHMHGKKVESLKGGVIVTL